MAAAHACLWSPRWQWQLTHAPGVCAGAVLLPERIQRERRSCVAATALLAPSSQTVVPCLSYQSQASSHTRFVVAHHTLPTSDCLYTANPGPLLGSNLQNPSLTPPAPADECLRLGSARWHLLSEGFFPLCPRKAVAALSSEAPKLPLCSS